MTTNTTKTTKPATSTKPAPKKTAVSKATMAYVVKLEPAYKAVRESVSTALNARETLASKLFLLVKEYSKIDRQRLLEYTSASGKRPAALQTFGDGIKGLMVPTWFNNPGLRNKAKRTLEEEKLYKRGMAEEKILSDTLPIVSAMIAEKAVEGVSVDRVTGTVVLINADKATKSARAVLGVARAGRKKGSTGTTTAAKTTTTPSATASATTTDGVAAQARDERAIASANVTRLAGELTARLSSKDWGELAESARDALLTLAALISERHNESEQAKARQQNAKAS